MTNNIENRKIPIFVSSTFLDLQKERDILTKNTFPKLEDLAMQRFVLLSALDLRWGVTDKEAESGIVLETCLNEIERCLPFFIGIIGDRYGWCPNKTELEKNSYLMERYKWLEKDITDGLSATEIEMQYAVFRKLHPVYAFFFIKKGRKKDEQNELKMQQLINNIVSGGKKFTSTNDNLSSLSDNQYYYTYYESPEELGQIVEFALLKLLDSLFPLEETGDLWSRESKAQKAYLMEQCKTYVPQVAYMWQMNILDRMEDRYIMITSCEESLYEESGFIANWLNQHLNDDSHNFIYHFLDAGFLDGDHKKILKRLCVEVAKLYGLPLPEDEFDEHQPNLREKLSETLDLIKDRKPLYIVLIGLHYLSDFNDEKNLNWLPVIPENVCLIVTAPFYDVTEEVFNRRYSNSYSLQGFNEDDGKIFITNYLSRLGKRLSTKQTEVVLRAYSHARKAPRGIKNLMTLKSLLKELTFFGLHEELDKRIAYYCEDYLLYFYNRMFERIENDYGRDCVRLIVSLIAYSRKGLKEKEILDISKATPMQWTNIRYSISQLLYIKADRFTFYKYIITKEINQIYNSYEIRARQLLIQYFSQNKDFHSIEELLFQYYKLHDIDSLYHTLLNMETFSYFYKNNIGELTTYWKALYEYSIEKYIMADYTNLHVLETASNAHLLADMGEFTKAMLGDDDSAKLLFSKSMEIYESIEHNDYETLAKIYSGLGLHSKAENAINSCLEITGSLHPRPESYYAELLSFKGLILIKSGRNEEALKTLKDALEITVHSKGEYNYATVEICRNLAIVCIQLEDEPQSKDYIEKGIELSSKIWGEKHLYLAELFFIYANFHKKIGNNVEAISYYQKALSIFEKWLPDNHLKIRLAEDSINDLRTQFNKPLKCCASSMECSLKEYRKNYPLSDVEFREMINYFEGIVDDLYIEEESWENGKREYDYKFKYNHDCWIGEYRLIFSPYSHTVYIYVNSLGMYESAGKPFENLKDAQIDYLIRRYDFYEQYCDYKESKYFP